VASIDRLTCDPSGIFPFPPNRLGPPSRWVQNASEFPPKALGRWQETLYRPGRSGLALTLSVTTIAYSKQRAKGAVLVVSLEALLLKASRGAVSRCRLWVYRRLGLHLGLRNRMEGGGRLRRCNQIVIGDYNAFTQGCWLWPADEDFAGIRIRIGNSNYFNRNLMIDACGLIEIGDRNIIGPDVYITDSNHQFGDRAARGVFPMTRGSVRIGNRCWIGAKAVILKDVVLGDGCVVGAGAVVTRAVAAGEVVVGVPAQAVSRARKTSITHESSSRNNGYSLATESTSSDDFESNTPIGDPR
jgi:maltose O-acetyltransferase